MGVRVIGTHSVLGLDPSLLSTIYPVIGLPPSEGCCHSMSIKFLSASTTLGFPGASGAAITESVQIKIVEVCGEMQTKTSKLKKEAIMHQTIHEFFFFRQNF